MKIIGLSKGGILTNSEEVIKVRVQHMWPNCEKYKSRYKGCCAEAWDKKLENVEYVPPPKTIAYIVPGTTKAPEGFEDVKVNDL